MTTATPPSERLRPAPYRLEGQHALIAMLQKPEYQRLYGQYLTLHNRPIPDRLLNELSCDQIASITTAMRNYEKKL